MVQMQPSSSLIGIGSLNNTSEVRHLSTEMHSQEEEHQHFQHHQQQQYDNQAAQQQQPPQQQHPQPNIDDFIEQMFLMPWEMNAQQQNTNNQKLYTMSLLPQQQQQQGGENLGYAYDESALLAARLRQHHINSNLNVALNPHANNSDSSLSPGRSMVLQLSTGNTNPSQLLSVMGNSPRNHAASPPQLPLSLGQGKPVDMNESRAREEIMANNAREASMGALFPAFPGSATRGLRPQGPSFHQQQIHQMQGYGGMPLPQHGVPPPSSGVGVPPARPRVRARRGQATDPHSIAERLRRERIAERMKALQELVPNSNKTDKASMLDEIIDYVKFLQLQVKVLSMSRLGGAGAVAPLVADMPSEGSNGQGKSNGAQQNSTSSDGMALTERQVAKLMEEDMGSAMQYLQGKGLCLMPISLATAISSSNKSQASQQQQHQSPLQGLFASVHHASIPEPANSSLSAITSLSSPTDTDNGKQHAVNGMRSIPKDGNPSKANGMIGAGPHLLNNANTADEESQSRRTCQ